MSFAANLSANAALFSPLTSAELDSIFRDEPTGPPTCTICFHPTNRWITFCTGGHSYCEGCVTRHVESLSTENRGCPECRLHVLRNSRGGYVENRTANEAHQAYVSTNPNWESDIRDFAAACPNVGPNGAGCYFTGTRDEMKQHLERECLFQQIKCPKTKFGCTHVGFRSEIQDHLERFDHSKYAFNLMEAMAEEAKKREDALNEKIGCLEGMLERTTTALASQQSTILQLATNIGEFRDREAATTSALTSLRAAVDVGNNHSRTFIDRLFRPGRNGGASVPIGPGSRPGGSATQRREHRRIERTARENRQLHTELARLDDHDDASIAVGRAEPVQAVPAVSSVAPVVHVASAASAASASNWPRNLLVRSRQDAPSLFANDDSDEEDEEDEIPLRGRNVRARHGSVSPAPSEH